MFHLTMTDITKQQTKLVAQSNEETIVTVIAGTVLAIAIQTVTATVTVTVTAETDKK
jgi:hypothetical protein